MITNEVFSCFVFYAVLLVLKMYVIAVITGQVRLRKKVSDFEWEGAAAEESHFDNLICFTDVMFLGFFPPPSPQNNRLSPTPRTRWDMEAYSITERTRTWRDAGGNESNTSISKVWLLFLVLFWGVEKQTNKKITFEYIITEASKGEWGIQTVK